MKHLFKHSKKDKDKEIEKEEKEKEEIDKEKKEEKKEKKDKHKHRHIHIHKEKDKINNEDKKEEEESKENKKDENNEKDEINEHKPRNTNIFNALSISRINEIKIDNNQEIKPLQFNSAQSACSITIPSLNIARAHPPSPLGTPPQQLPSGLSSLSQPSQQPLSPRSSSSSSSSITTTTTATITLTEFTQQQQQQKSRPPPSPLHTHIEINGKKANSLSPKDKLENIPSYLTSMDYTKEATLSRKDKRKSLFSPLFSRNLFGEPSSPRRSVVLPAEKSVPTSPRNSMLQKEETKEKRRSVVFRRGVSLNTIPDKEQQPVKSPTIEISKDDVSNDKKPLKRHSKKKSVDLAIKYPSPVEVSPSERANYLQQSSQNTNAFGRKNRRKIMSMQIKDPSVIYAANNVPYEPEINTARYNPHNETHSAAHSRKGSTTPKRLIPIHVPQSIFREAKKDIFSLMSSYSFQNWKMKNSQFFHIHGKNRVSDEKNDDDDVKDDANDDVITLAKVLENPEMSKSFELFLKSEFSAENIYFYREAERFEQQTFESQLEMDREALRIYEKFLAPGTDLQVNVSSGVLGKVHLELFGEPISKDENDQSWMRWFVPTEYSPKAVEVANAAAAAASARSGYGANGMNGNFENQGSQLPPQIACLISSSSQPSMVDLSDKTKKRRSIFFKKT